MRAVYPAYLDRPAETLPVGEAVVIPLAMAFGGTAQIIAGIMEFKTGNVFGATAFTSYGAFWWWFALLILLGAYFLVRESLPTVDIDRAWPVAVIVVGVAFLGLSFRRGSGPA